GTHVIEDKWNESFGREDFIYGTIANEFIKDHAHQFSTDSKIACLAEGEGRNAVHLARLGHDITAYDVSEVGLEKSAKLAQTNNVSIETEKINLIVEDFIYGTIANEFIKDHAHQFSTDSKIACLAEGEGRNAVHLARLGHDITAYDVSEVGLEKSAKLAQTNNVSIETEKLNLIEEDL